MLRAQAVDKCHPKIAVHVGRPPQSPLSTTEDALSCARTRSKQAHRAHSCASEQGVVAEDAVSTLAIHCCARPQTMVAQDNLPL